MQVSKVLKMSDEKRLDLLKEIAGTRVYDERRSDSQKIMHDTEIKTAQIQVDFALKKRAIFTVFYRKLLIISPKESTN